MAEPRFCPGRLEENPVKKKKPNARQRRLYTREKAILDNRFAHSHRRPTHAELLTMGAIYPAKKPNQ